MGRSLDLLGQVFGKLTVVSDTGRRTSGYVVWECQCECGTRTEVSTANLTAGRTRSCRQGECCNRTSGQKAATQVLYSRYRSSAVRRGFAFDLSVQLFADLIHRPCAYCGRSPSNILRHRRYKDGGFRYGGVDRIDNEIGYESSNCVPCCAICNRAKRTMRSDDWFSWIDALISFKYRQSFPAEKFPFESISISIDDLPKSRRR